MPQIPNHAVPEHRDTLSSVRRSVWMQDMWIYFKDSSLGGIYVLHNTLTYDLSGYLSQYDFVPLVLAKFGSLFHKFNMRKSRYPGTESWNGIRITMDILPHSS